MTPKNDALELDENKALSKFAAEREQTFDKIKALSHSEVWQQDQAG
jgi:hypothetical protein